jgi:Phosphoglycerate dehydrogenase and related dehydrogenases
MAEVFSPRDLDRLRETVDVVWGRDEPIAVEDAQEAMADVTAVVAYGWRYGRLPERTPNLRAIIDVAGGMPHGLDYDDCFARGIRVMSAAPSFARQVAEMALGLALASSRDIVSGDMAMRRGEELWLHAGTVDSFLLYGQPVGMIGYGSIARSLRPLLAPFDCPISAYDPWLADGYLRSQGVQPAALEHLLSTSRVIFVLAVPSAENRALLTRDLLELIRSDAVLILVSRAHVVDFDALTELVSAGRFKAAIDVFPTEPLSLDHPIRRAPGTVLSAHHAGAVKEGLWELGEYIVDDLEAIARNLPPQRLQVAVPELIGRLMGR